VPLSGLLAVHADPATGLFTGDLVLHQSTVSRTILGASLFSVTIQIAAKAPVNGRVDHEGQMSATVMVDVVITAARAAGATLIRRRFMPHRDSRHCTAAFQARPQLRTGPPRGRQIPPAALHRMRMDHPTCQPAGRWPGERHRHRSHPAHVLRQAREACAAPRRRPTGGAAHAQQARRDSPLCRIDGLSAHKLVNALHGAQCAPLGRFEGAVVARGQGPQGKGVSPLRRGHLGRAPWVAKGQSG
jgi:hypothetical protein